MLKKCYKVDFVSNTFTYLIKIVYFHLSHHIRFFDDTDLQTQDSKSDPWRYMGEHATPLSLSLPAAQNPKMKSHE